MVIISQDQIFRKKWRHAKNMVILLSTKFINTKFTKYKIHSILNLSNTKFSKYLKSEFLHPQAYCDYAKNP